MKFTPTPFVVVLSKVRQFTAAALPIALGATMMWTGVLTLLVTTRASGQELNKELNEAIVMIPKKGFLFTERLNGVRPHKNNNKSK